MGTDTSGFYKVSDDGQLLFSSTESVAPDGIPSPASDMPNAPLGGWAWFSSRSYAMDQLGVHEDPVPTDLSEELATWQIESLIENAAQQQTPGEG